MSRQARIIELLTQHFNPTYLMVEDESGNHHVPKGSESHFKITLASLEFTDKTQVARHRLVNALVKDEFNTGLHALSMHLYTPKEWDSKQHSVLESPKCRDGFGN